MPALRAPYHQIPQERVAASPERPWEVLQTRIAPLRTRVRPIFPQGCLSWSSCILVQLAWVRWAMALHRRLERLRTLPPSRFHPHRRRGSACLQTPAWERVPAKRLGSQPNARASAATHEAAWALHGQRTVKRRHSATPLLPFGCASWPPRVPGKEQRRSRPPEVAPATAPVDAHGTCATCAASWPS